MHDDELKKFIDQIVQRLKNGEQVEENKLELKSIWYNFSDQVQRKKIESEFLKDLSAIANTPGPTGYLIVGINEKSGEVTNSPFSESGLRDITELQKMVVKCVDRPIDFELKEIKIKINSQENIYSIFEIPPSLEKPHVISHYLSFKDKEIQNFIPIKKVTGIYPATRSDIELMYYDRKNIEPEYALDILTYAPRINISGSSNEVRITFQLCLQNSGRKPITIVDLSLLISEISLLEHAEEIRAKLYTYYKDYSREAPEYYFNDHYIIVPSNYVNTLRVNFKILVSDLRIIQYLQNKENQYRLFIETQDIFSKKYISEIKEFIVR